MQLPPLKRFQKSDFPDAPEWFDKLLIILNSFFENVYRLLNGRLSVVDNLQSELLTIKGPAPFAQRRYPIHMKYVNAVILAGIAGPSYTDTVVLRAHQDGDELVIEDLSGLTAGSTYTVRILLV